MNGVIKYTGRSRPYVFLATCALMTLVLSSLSGCQGAGQLNTFEKHVAIPGYKWNYDFQPSFDIVITDTAARYNIDVTLRHTEAYGFSNLWLLVTTNRSGQKPKTQRVELPLADRQGRWLGTGADDIFEHRIPIQQHARFDQAGTYHFRFEQNMRINPLPHIMSVGLRIEKVPF